jgi:ectoine hydroxylase-related dioxygenase (phytanoyl-CoA dioxygenase family)
MHPKLHRLAAGLARVPLRLWHDQLLVKFPQKSVPTEFHQDQPYWPHQGQPAAITAWIALDHVPEEMGCLSFIPGSHSRSTLPEQDLTDPRSLFELCPEFEWLERVSVPLRAGDCTFHHGRTAHMAGANLGSKPRLGYAVIFIEDGTRFSGAPHPITDPLGLKPGTVLEGSLFPRIGRTG